jgi:hypothetical protein
MSVYKTTENETHYSMPNTMSSPMYRKRTISEWLSYFRSERQSNFIVETVDNKRLLKLLLGELEYLRSIGLEREKSLIIENIKNIETIHSINTNYIPELSTYIQEIRIPGNLKQNSSINNYLAQLREIIKFMTSKVIMNEFVSDTTLMDTMTQAHQLVHEINDINYR